MSSSLLIMLYRIMPSDSRYLTIIQLRLPITSKMYHPPPVPKMLFKRRPRRPKDHLKGTPGPGILKSLQNAGSAGRPSAFKKEALGTSLGRPPPPPAPKMPIKSSPRRPKDHLKETPGPGILNTLQSAGSTDQPEPLGGLKLSAHMCWIPF